MPVFQIRPWVQCWLYTSAVIICLYSGWNIITTKNIKHILPQMVSVEFFLELNLKISIKRWKYLNLPWRIFLVEVFPVFWLQHQLSSQLKHKKSYLNDYNFSIQNEIRMESTLTSKQLIFCYNGGIVWIFKFITYTKLMS